MNHHFLVAVSFLSVAVLLAVSMWAHASASSTIYSALQRAHHDGSAPAAFFAVDFTTGAAKVGTDLLQKVARDGVSFSWDSHVEATYWAIALLVVVVVFFGVGYFRM